MVRMLKTDTHKKHTKTQNAINNNINFIMNFPRAVFSISDQTSLIFELKYLVIVNFYILFVISKIKLHKIKEFMRNTSYVIEFAILTQISTKRERCVQITNDGTLSSNVVTEFAYKSTTARQIQLTA